MKKLNKYIGACLLAIALSSCHKDLDLKPTNDVTADIAYKDFKGYTSSFARLYGSLTRQTNHHSAHRLRSLISFVLLMMWLGR